MQDKDFDRLLNSKLGDFEVEPSPMVWDNIADELHGKKAKRSLVPYLSIAASVIILASVGLLFFKQDTADKSVKPTKVAVKVDQPTEPAKTTDAITNPVINAPVNRFASVSKHTGKTVAKAITAEAGTQTNPTVEVPMVTAPVEAQQQVLVAVTPPVQNQTEMTVPDKTTSFAAEPQIIERITTVTASSSTDDAPAPVKRRGIRSLGGLINAIVAKVDKRQDKLIEFTEDGDEGSNITGVNLGLVKIKKQ